MEPRGVEGAVEEEGLEGGGGALQGLLQPGPLGPEVAFRVEDEDLEAAEADPVVGPLQAEAAELGLEVRGVVVAEGGVEGDGGEVLKVGLHHPPSRVEVVPGGEEGGEGALGVLLAEEGRHLGPPPGVRPPVPDHPQALGLGQGEGEKKGDEEAQEASARPSVAKHGPGPPL